MPADARPNERWERPAFGAGMVLLSAMLVWSVCVVPYLPTNDGPQNILSAHIENHFSDPGTIYRDQLQPAPQFAYKGFAAIFAPLEAALGWRDGLRVTLSLAVLGTAWASAAVILAIERQRRFVAFLSFPLALTWPLYMGFFAFVIGTAIGLGILAYALSPSSVAPKKRVLLSLLLLVEAVAHLFTAALTGLVVSLVFVARAERGKRLTEAGKCAIMGIPAAAILALATRYPAPSAAFSEYLRIPWTESIRWLNRVVLPGPPGRATIALCVMVFALVGAGWRARTRSLTPNESALAIASVGLLFLGVFSPLNMSGWQLFSPRFLALAAFLALALVPAERLVSRPARAALALTAFSAAALSMATTAAFHRRMAAGCADAIAGLSAPIRRRALQLPITLQRTCGVSSDERESEVPFSAPLLHIGALYAVVEGGSIPYLFAGSPSVHAFTFRTDGTVLPPAPAIEAYWPIVDTPAFDADLGLRKKVLTGLAAYGMRYEGIIVAGARPTDLAELAERGYVTDWQQGFMLLAHFASCKADLVFSSEDAAMKPRVEVGMEPEPVPLVDMVVSAPIPDGNLSHAKLSRLPCGEAWLRVTWPSEPGRPSEGRRCANADRDGRIRATLTRKSATVTCSGAPDSGPPAR